MNRFQKIQKLSSIIPFWSTFFITITTMIELSRHKASKKIWLYFVSTFFISGIVVYLVNAFLMTGQHIVLNIIVSGLILAIANILFVDLQIMSAKTETSPMPANNTTSVLVYCVLVAAFVGVTCLLMLFLTPSVDIDDTNGSEQTNLAVIDTDSIISSKDYYSAFSSYISHRGNNTFVSGRLKEYDYDEVEFSCQKISGVKTLQVTKTPREQLILEIDTQLQAGNLEIVVIVNDSIHTRVAANELKTIVLTDIAEKTVLIKLAAESAKAVVSVRRSVKGQGVGDKGTVCKTQDRGRLETA